jgi:cobalamin biosynthesis protein CobD/CbiB
MPPLSSLIDLSRLSAPLALLIFSILADIGTRLMVPALRDYLQPLLGIPTTIWQWLQQKLARTNRTSIELQKRGMLALLIMLGVTAAIAVGFDRVAHVNRYGVYLLWYCIWHWSVTWTLARDVLMLPTPTTASYAVIHSRRLSPLSPPVPANADAATVYRHVIMIMGDSLVGGLMAPLFYTLVVAACGYPAFYGAALGVVASVIKAPVGLDATKRLFYRPANAISQLILFIPGRLIAVIMLLATLFTPKAKTYAAVRLVLKHGHQYPDQSVSWVMAIISGAFAIALPTGRGSQWLGHPNATAQITKGEVQRVVWLHVIAVLLVLLILCATLLLSM